MTPSEREALVARVRVTLAERDAKYSHPDYDREPLETSHLDWRDLLALCAEVERLTRERDEARSAVLAEVRAKVEGLTVVRDGVSPASMSYVTPAQFREQILSNLTALEATNGR